VVVVVVGLDRFVDTVLALADCSIGLCILVDTRMRIDFVRSCSSYRRSSMDSVCTDYYSIVVVAVVMVE
jgi:hypothetical protein